MKQLLYIGALILLTSSCQPEVSQKKLTFQNLVIFSDLSSRVSNKTLKDLEEISKIINYFKDECVQPGEKTGDRSSIQFSTFSNREYFIIDIDKFKSLDTKQKYINSTEEFQNNGFIEELAKFEENINATYKSTKDPGLDLISMLREKIVNGSFIKKNVVLTNGTDSAFINFENHIYIFTDGYLEYTNKNINKQYYFGIPEIQKIRDMMIQQNVDVYKLLELNPRLCLPPIEEELFNLVHLHVLETHERDKDERLSTYKFPNGQRDNDILEAVWRKWANDSGFKSFSWKKY